LLGDRVRYDAQVKQYPELLQFIQQHFDIISVCPEVEIGLSVPRPPVQLSGELANIKVTGRDAPDIDITADMQAYCQRRPPQLKHIQGYIFKSKSPSCGIENIPIFNSTGETIDTTSGVFVSAILQHYPKLPITDEMALQTTVQREAFLQRINCYRTVALSGN